MKRTLLAAALSLFAATAFAAPVTYQLDPSHTNVIATWSHFGFSNPSAHFGQAKGTLVYDAADVGKSSVEVTLPLSGLSGFAADFDEHLNSADFFESSKYPDAKFKSTKVEAAGEGKLKVTGDLTIKDQTKPVVFDVTLNKAGEAATSSRASASTPSPPSAASVRRRQVRAQRQRRGEAAHHHRGERAEDRRRQVSPVSPGRRAHRRGGFFFGV